MPDLSRKIRVIVVDDHPVVCDGVGLLIATDPSISIVGCAATGREAITVAREVTPDVVLLDLRLPDMLATETMGALRTAVPGVRVVIFTAHGDHAAIDAIIDDGADGVLLKDASTTDLISAIHRVACGMKVVDPRLSERSGSQVRSAIYRVGLTRREYDVLRLVAMGCTNPEVAEQLELARNTVKTYLQNVMHKLGARNRVEAIGKAHEAHLL